MDNSSDISGMSDSDAQGWENAEWNASHPSVSITKSGIGIIFLFLFIGVVLVGMFTYLPGQLDERYTGGGQVIGMVNPSGTNPNVDMQYSEINRGNADANLTNSRAYQRQSVVWMAWVFCFMGFGIVIFVFNRLTRANKA